MSRSRNDGQVEIGQAHVCHDPCGKIGQNSNELYSDARAVLSSADLHLYTDIGPSTLYAQSDREPKSGGGRMTRRSLLISTLTLYLPLIMAPYQLTPAQLEKQAARQAAKLAKAEGRIPNTPKLSPEELERRRFLKREWLNVRSSNPSSSSPSSSERKVRILSWNVSAPLDKFVIAYAQLLAQTLVRECLFS